MLKPIQQVILGLFFICLSNLTFGQKYSSMNANFTIKEVNTQNDKSTLIMGAVFYDNVKSIIEYDIKFPKKEKWIIKDSTLFKYVSDSLMSTSKASYLNEQMVFKSILEYDNQDFGLKEAGFTIASVSEYKDGVVLEWSPPIQMEDFMQKVISQLKDNLLQSIIFIDVDGKQFNKTYYENYEYINNLPVPLKISSHFMAKKQEIFKVIAFKNVEIN